MKKYRILGSSTINGANSPTRNSDISTLNNAIIRSGLAVGSPRPVIGINTANTVVVSEQKYVNGISWPVR